MNTRQEVIINFKEPILKAIQYTREYFSTLSDSSVLNKEEAEKSVERYDVLYRKISSGAVLNEQDYGLIKLVAAYQAEKMANEAQRLQEAATTMVNIAKILHTKN